jgi:hypothetical protein
MAKPDAPARLNLSQNMSFGRNGKERCFFQGFGEISGTLRVFTEAVE